jgi:2-oxoisovalerate dehydrogenase E1 component alpha subunit
MRLRVYDGLFRPLQRKLTGIAKDPQLRQFSARASLCQSGHGALRFPGALEAKFTTSLKLHNPKENGVFPCYRVMDTEGAIVDRSYKRDISDEEAVKLYTTMVGVSIMDLICLDAQRQGRTSFYMVSAGEEGIAVGSASALRPEDVAFAQYRELGLFLQRGLTFDQCMSQIFANSKDTGLGRNMPVHYGSRELNIHTISSPLATQLPHAAGAAYALKMQRLTDPNIPPRCVVAYFGEGAASEGDFHAALNISATRSCPVIYICRNNGYAISTPTLEQYRGDGIASRGAGYGIETIRVDGNDILAVREVTRRARELSLGLDSGSKGNTKPILIEAMSYRVSHHSTSDDSFAYRARVEVEDWKRRDNPITRFRKYLESQGLWDDEKEKQARERIRKEVLKAFSQAEKEKRAPIRSMFEDVYEELTPDLKEQMGELKGMIDRYPGEYDVSEFEGGKESLKP